MPNFGRGGRTRSERREPAREWVTWSLREAGIIFARMMPRAATSIAILVLSVAPAVAAAASFTIELPESDAAIYEIPFRVDHPGLLVVEAQWDDPRIVAIRVEGPTAIASRRSGPSPQRIEIPVADDPGLLRGGWRLWLRVPPGRTRTQGTLTLTLPDPPDVVAAREAALKPPPPPPPAPDPWTLPRTAPPGASAAVEELFSAFEPLRARVYPVGVEPSPDGCGWQRPLTRWLVEILDRAASGTYELPPAATELLKEIARAVREVEGLRTSDNPLLAGPVPEEPLRKRAWLAARRDELRGLERRLDGLAERLRGAQAPELAALDWPSRLVACVTAAERHFEERGRLGDEAVNREIAEMQWPVILAAARALDAAAALEGLDPSGRAEIGLP